jgi:3-oxoacyl-[acyl-carrier-protein] synthase-3
MEEIAKSGPLWQKGALQSEVLALSDPLWRSRVIGTGSGFPDRIMKNSEFETFLDTSDEWIRTRTGIEERRICDPAKGETSLTLAHRAALEALKRADLPPSELDCILVGTITPETVMPTNANQLQRLLGANKAFGFDFQAACSGWLYGLAVADSFIRTGTIRNALVIGVEVLSTIIDWRDRTTCVLFGDGAGATVLQRTDSTDHAVLGTRLYADGSGGDSLHIPHGYGKVPPDSAAYRHDLHKVQMNGSEVFKHAVRNMQEASLAVLADHGLTPKDVDFFLFHQANLRIVDMCMRGLDVPAEKTWLNLQKYGNTSAATLPVALDEAWRAGKVKSGDLVLATTFGGGFTWGSTLIRL